MSGDQGTSRFLTHPGKFSWMDQSENKAGFYSSKEKERSQDMSLTMKEAESTLPSGYEPTQERACIGGQFLGFYVLGVGRTEDLFKLCGAKF